MNYSKEDIETYVEEIPKEFKQEIPKTQRKLYPEVRSEPAFKELLHKISGKYEMTEEDKEKIRSKYNELANELYNVQNG